MTTVPSLLPLSAPAAIRLRAFYRSAGTLLRELSRALNVGHTILRADSGLPVGTRLSIVMVAEALGEPIEVSGTITECLRRGPRYRIGLRYDFDSGPHRARIAAAIAVLRGETVAPRREARVPLALRVEASGLDVTVANASPRGLELALSGLRLPALTTGSRLFLSLSGSQSRTRAVIRVEFEVRWVGPTEGSGRRRRILVGGRFASASPEVRARLRSILRFEELRPRIRIRRIVLAKKKTTKPRRGR
jgi:PilZ domain